MYRIPASYKSTPENWKKLVDSHVMRAQSQAAANAGDGEFGFRTVGAWDTSVIPGGLLITTSDAMHRKVDEFYELMADRLKQVDGEQVDGEQVDSDE